MINIAIMKDSYTKNIQIFIINFVKDASIKEIGEGACKKR